MQASLLSIVMPCLNGMPHIPNAIASIRSALPADSYEVIVADGGSTDGTLDYLDGANVAVVHGPDRSIYDGLNKAIAQANGAYIAWLNADDILLPAIAALWEIARDHNADLATGEARIKSDSRPDWTSDHCARPLSQESVLFGVPTINSRLFSTMLLRRIGPFAIDDGLGADRLMMLRLTDPAIRRVALSKPVYQYVAHAGSRTMGGSWSSNRNVQAAHLQMIASLRNQQDVATDADLLRALTATAVLAKARASALSGRPLEALGEALAGWARDPLPTSWIRGELLRRQYRGKGSGY